MGHRLSADILLLSFQQELMVLDLLHRLPCWLRSHIVDRRPLEPFESRNSRNSVSTHVFKERPIAHMHLGQVTTLNNAIKAVTCWYPYAGWILLLSWFGFLLHEGLYVCMITNNAIKWFIYSIIHVIPKGLFVQLIFIIRVCLFL